MHDAKPDVAGLILHKHGIFTFAETAREAYELMIDMVSRAEARLAKGRRNVFAPAALPAEPASAPEIAPIIRGACAVPATAIGGEPRRFVLTFRSGPEILNYVNGADLADYSQRGVVTPDHIIRTKNRPLVVPAPAKGGLDAFKAAVRAAVDDYVARYDAIFARENARAGKAKIKLDPMPRVVLVPGVGLFGIGHTAKDAAIAADLAENAIRVITDAEAIGRFEPLPESDLFDVEYWSLEQAKLKGAVAKAFTGQVALVTGAGGGIGLATAERLRRRAPPWSCSTWTRRQPRRRPRAWAASVSPAMSPTARACAPPSPGQPSISAASISSCRMRARPGRGASARSATRSCAGASSSISSPIRRVAQEAVAIMLKQGTGGVLLFNISKQAVNPGADFGPYGLPKAATLALMRQYAVDYGPAGIRANGVNADRIRTGLLTDEMIAKRSKARGLSEADYMGGNLLKREVIAADVAQAFVALAKARATTGHVETVDGGNIAAALR